jgi:hypothetical protein
LRTHGNVGNIWQLTRLSQPFLIFSKLPSFRLLESSQPSFLLLESDQVAELFPPVAQTAERISTTVSESFPKQPSRGARTRGDARGERGHAGASTVSGRGADRGDPSSSLPRLRASYACEYCCWESSVWERRSNLVNTWFSWEPLKGARVCRSKCVLLCRREWCGGVVALLGFSACTFLPDCVLERGGRAGAV